MRLTLVPQSDQDTWTTLDQWATKSLLSGEVHEQISDMLEWWEHRYVPSQTAVAANRRP